MTHTMNVTRVVAGLVLLFVLLGPTVTAHAGSHGDTGSTTDSQTGNLVSSETVGIAGILFAIGAVLFVLKGTGRLAEIRSRLGI